LRLLARRLRESSAASYMQGTEAAVPSLGSSNLDQKLRLRAAARRELQQLSKARTFSASLVGVIGFVALLLSVIFRGAYTVFIAAGTLVSAGTGFALVWKLKSKPIRAKRMDLIALQGDAAEAPIVDD